MLQIWCIAIYSRWLGAPENIRHPKLQYAATQHVLFTTTVRIDWIHVSKHRQPLLRIRRKVWLHCLTRLRNCHQHSHVSSTHARAHALWCALQHDSLTYHNITYLARDESHFCVMTLTFDVMTFNFCSASAVTWPNHAHVTIPVKLFLLHNPYNRYHKSKSIFSHFYNL